MSLFILSGIARAHILFVYVYIFVWQSHFGNICVYLFYISFYWALCLCNVHNICAHAEATVCVCAIRFVLFAISFLIFIILYLIKAGVGPFANQSATSSTTTTTIKYRKHTPTHKRCRKPSHENVSQKCFFHKFFSYTCMHIYIYIYLSCNVRASVCMFKNDIDDKYSFILLRRWNQ